MLVASGRMENGIIGNHVVNWLSPVKERATVVNGENGVFVANTLTGDLTLHRNGHFYMNWDSLATFRGVSEGETIKLAFPRTEPLWMELSDFFQVVRNGGEPAGATIVEGINVVRITQRLLSS